MPIKNEEKYKDVPGYQQVCSDKTVQRFSDNGRIIHIIPTADKCFHTFMIKPDGRPFLVYRRFDYFTPILVAGFVVLVGIFQLQPRPLYAGLAIVLLSLATWGIVRLAKASARKRKPIVTVDKHGITHASGSYPWNTIINTFNATFIMNGRRRADSEEYLILTLTNQKTILCRLNRFSGIRDEISELATTITYFRNNDLSCLS